MKLTNLAFGIVFGVCTVAAPVMAQDIILKASHNANAEEPYGVGMREMASILEKKTGGQATIEVYDNATLGDEMESIQGTQMGTVDIAVTSNSTLTNFVPDLSVFSLPFMFEDAAQMDRALSDPEVLAQIQSAVEEKGFHLLAVFSAGTRHIMTKKPIHSIVDMDGLKIRTMQNPAHVDTFNAFGANATAIAYAELYGALETGVVDGAEAANTNFYSKKFYEVAPNWAVVGWLELVAPVVMGKAAYDKLPEDIQDALDEAGVEAGKAERAAYLASDNARFADLEAEGVNITHPDRVPFREAAATVQQKYVKTDGQKLLFDLLKSVE
jgi:tripartite ATP-independent transporter DctP family solute receptor